MSAALGEGPSSALDSTYGAYLIGVLFATFFQGLLTVQVWNYYENFPRDPLKFKILVLIVWILDTVHLVIICQTVYHYLVTNWGFVPALNNVTLDLVVHIALIGLSCLICQIFFLHRIWVFSNRNYVVVGGVLMLCLATFALSIHLPIHLITKRLHVSQLAGEKPEVTALFLTGATSDLLIAGLLCYYLRQEFTGFKATRSIVGQVLHYALATGVATSALAIGAVIALFAAPMELHYIAMHLSLGRVYSNSLLATLNARKKMREVLKGSHHTDTLVKAGTGLGPRAGLEPALNRDAFQMNMDAKPVKDDSFSYRYTVERVTNHDDNLNMELDAISPKRVSLTVSV